jgi:hypothetical protein
MCNIERRIQSGEVRPEDAQWLGYLDAVFAEVPLSGFVAQGMAPHVARRFVALLALARRLLPAAS